MEEEKWEQVRKGCFKLQLKNKNQIESQINIGRIFASPLDKSYWLMNQKKGQVPGPNIKYIFLSYFHFSISANI